MNGSRISMQYSEPLPSQNEFCRDETTVRMEVGFLLDSSDLEAGMIVEKCCPVAVDFTTRMAKPCKGVRVIKAATATDTALQVSKGHLVKVGDIIGDGTKKATISAINKSNANYDVLTLEATLAVAVKINTVLHECTSGSAKAKNKAVFLNYRRTHVTKDGLKQTVTTLAQAYEIKGDLTPNPCSEEDKANLGDRYLFIN